jgi:hypothetical protein
LYMTCQETPDTLAIRRRVRRGDGCPPPDSFVGAYR